MKYILISLILICLSCKKGKKQFEIIGNTKEITENTKLYLFDFRNNSYLDSCIVKNSNFKFTGHVPYPKECEIQYITNDKKINKLTVWIENSKITINIKDKYLQEYSVKGSEIHNQFELFPKTVPPTDKVDFDNLYRTKEKYVKNHPNYLYSAVILNKICRPHQEFKLLNVDMTTYNQTKQLFDNLNSDVKESYYGKAISSFLENYKNYQIGDTVHNFELNGINGNKINLSDYRGKYVLLYFWNYGCDGVIKLHNILSQYQSEMKKKNIEIVGISLDSNEKLWKEESLKQGLKWKNLNDPDGENGFIGTTFGFGGVLSIFLLDKEDRILSVGYDSFKEINRIK